MSFWQKVQNGVNRAATEVKEQATVTRLHLKLGETRSEIRRKIADLGEAALPLVRDGSIKNETLSAIVAEIRALEEVVASLELELAQTKGEAGHEERAIAPASVPTAAAGSVTPEASNGAVTATAAETPASTATT